MHPGQARSRGEKGAACTERADKAPPREVDRASRELWTSSQRDAPGEKLEWRELEELCTALQEGLIWICRDELAALARCLGEQSQAQAHRRAKSALWAWACGANIPQCKPFPVLLTCILSVPSSLAGPSFVACSCNKCGDSGVQLPCRRCHSKGEGSIEGVTVAAKSVTTVITFTVCSEGQDRLNSRRGLCNTLALLIRVLNPATKHTVLAPCKDPFLVQRHNCVARGSVGAGGSSVGSHSLSPFYRCLSPSSVQVTKVVAVGAWAQVGSRIRLALGMALVMGMAACGLLLALQRPLWLLLDASSPLVLSVAEVYFYLRVAGVPPQLLVMCTSGILQGYKVWSSRILRTRCRGSVLRE